MDPEVLVSTRFDTAVRTAANFLSVFLGKCGVKNNEEVDYRPLFENFVQDLLSTVNKPEWPAAELLLALLGKLLVNNFSNKNVDVTLRVASLEYLGVVAARLRKDAVTSQLRTDTIDQLLKQLREDKEKDAQEEFKSKKHKKKKHKSGDKDNEKEVMTPEDKTQVAIFIIRLVFYLILHLICFYLCQISGSSIVTSRLPRCEFWKRVGDAARASLLRRHVVHGHQEMLIYRRETCQRYRQ